MGQKLSDCIARCSQMDWGVLYLRMALGAALLLRNIGKMQAYNEIINTYPSLFHLGGAVIFVVVAVAEVLLAVLLMLGLWVRPAAALTAAGMLWIFFTLGFPAGESSLIYAAIAIGLCITGGGVFAFDTAMMPSKKKKREAIN